MHIKRIIVLSTIIGGLFMGNILYAKPPIFIKNYNEAVKVSQEFNQPLILIFSADWCAYCVRLKKDISKNLDKFDDTTICIIDIDDQPEIAKKYNATKIPKSIFFDKQGKKIREITGYFDVKSLKK